MGTVIVGGVVANKWRNGGATWTRLSWALGLKRLGLRVYFVEQLGRANCTDAAGAAVAFEESVNLAYFREVMEGFGLSDTAALIYEDGEQVHGLSYPELLDVAGAADA